jgi:hypothetical protein
MINLWLDDERPAPDGWVHVKTDAEARVLLAQGIVQDASLDHDLGACDDCMRGGDKEDWLSRTKYREMPNCIHFGTGYTLICWIEETGHWPKGSISVHSANAAGRAKMMAAIKNKERSLALLNAKIGGT